jgi:hypothetical protein
VVWNPILYEQDGAVIMGEVSAYFFHLDPGNGEMDSKS